MNRPRWDNSEDLWEADGSLRDVYVKETSISDWKALVDLAASYGYEYSFDGETRSMPDVEEVFANREGSHLLSIRVGTITVNCHLFIPSEIELDIDPREVKGPIEHELLLEFVERLAHAVGKPVLVTPENGIEVPFVSYEPSSHAWASYG